MTTDVQARDTDEFGRFFIVTITLDDEERVVNIHRAPVEPGHWEDGQWVPTDLVSLPESVWKHALTIWTAPTIAKYKEAFPWVPAPQPALPVLEPYQFFAVLEISGKKTALDNYINSLPSPQNIVVRAKLDRSLAFHRDNDLVLAAQAALNISDTELDALWRQAAAL